MVPVQFIIQASTAEECLKQAEAVLTAGGKWIELCVASLSSNEAAEVSTRLLKECHTNDATFCVVDDVELCKAVGADGVFMTGEDARVDEVREALGHEFMIGAAAGDLQQLKLLKRMSVDYVRLCYSGEMGGLNNVIREAYERQLRLPIGVQLVGALSYGDAQKVMAAGADGLAINCNADMSVDLGEAVRTLLHLDD